MLPTAAVALVMSLAVLYVATDGESQPWRILRCFLGFVIAMVWIAVIADHVVDVLQAFGEILGLSDAIVGLTSKRRAADATVADSANSFRRWQQFGGLGRQRYCRSIRTGDGVCSVLRKSGLGSQKLVLTIPGRTVSIESLSSPAVLTRDL